ncbi:MAG: hypothetical protein ABI325_13715 [Ginsengibacter sp.]
MRNNSEVRRQMYEMIERWKRSGLSRKSFCEKESLKSQAYGKLINDYSSKELEKIFDAHISKKDEQVRTDKWTGYSPLKSKWNIEMIKSEKGKSSLSYIH